MWVILPHLIVGNPRQIYPKRCRLISLRQSARAISRSEDGYVQLVAIDKLKKKFPDLLQSDRCHSDFFLSLTNRRLERRLTLLQPPTRPIDLPCTQSALFSKSTESVPPS